MWRDNSVFLKLDEKRGILYQSSALSIYHQLNSVLTLLIKYVSKNIKVNQTAEKRFTLKFN